MIKKFKDVKVNEVFEFNGDIYIRVRSNDGGRYEEQEPNCIRIFLDGQISIKSDIWFHEILNSDVGVCDMTGRIIGE